MKILHINNAYFQTKLYPLLQRALNDTGACVSDTVACTPVGSRHEPDPHVTDLPILQKADRLSFFYKQHKMLARMEQTIDIAQYDICHAYFLFTAGNLANRIKKKYGIPYIVMVQNTDIYTFLRYRFWLRPLGCRIMAEADAIVFFSPSYRDTMLSGYVPDGMRDTLLAKSHVLPSGIDAFWLENRAAKVRATDPQALRLVYAGEINRNKNLLATAKACAGLIAMGYAVTYTAVGKISNARIARALEKFPFYRHIAPQDKEGLREIYRGQDIFIMPSIHESFGLVYPEAMSQGLPVIYTRGQGFDGQFAEGEVGYGVDCRRPAEIIEKILLILNDYDAISARCAETCGRFDWKQIACEYLALYDGCGTEKRPARMRKITMQRNLEEPSV